MYLMYIDESGDTGHNNSPTDHFVVSAIVIHEEDWLNVLNDFIKFRRAVKEKFGLKMSEEIHAAPWLNNNPNLYPPISKWDRMVILRACLKWLNNRSDISVFAVRCYKPANRNKDVFDLTWEYFIQRFNNTLEHGNFPKGRKNDRGLVMPDNTHGKKLTKLMRRMRRYNIVPSKLSTHGLGARQLNVKLVIEDPAMRDSKDSYIHQLADVVAFFIRMNYEPNRYVRKKGAHNFARKFLSKVLNPHIVRNTSLKGVKEV
ncbi:uncharacterized protein DUF3800 [Neolewinella xylanilytica]|uniref:Uncharacterized protein DUF3800 n=2 Tax=Neolewinella xylanilytica TaxID=1514080 RepID=A0A2S6I737_9BACT|nr:uncharacterized protein DUF3800 [Neolewinella xylanilytica]